MARSRATTFVDSGATQLEQASAQVVQKVEPLVITQLPPRADAHCSEGIDSSLSELERQAAGFQCRQAIARQQAEAACDGLATGTPQPPFKRASLNIAVYANGVYPGGGARTVPAAVDIAVEPMSDIVSNEIIARGTWEFSEVRTILDGLLRANATVGNPPAVLVDVGANLGVFTITAAALGFPVIAFEAMSRNVDAIHQTLCWNPELRERVTLFPYGLSDTERSCLVVSDGTNVADGHLVCDDAEIAAMAGAHSRAPVHSVRLADYLAGIQTDVMKIDVEGYEMHVLAGAGAALDTLQYALSELSAIDMPRASGRAIGDVGLEYLSAWHDRGFTITMCYQQSDCFTGTPMTPEEALAATIRGDIINVLFQKHANADGTGAISSGGAVPVEGSPAPAADPGGGAIAGAAPADLAAGAPRPAADGPDPMTEQAQVSPALALGGAGAGRAADGKHGAAAPLTGGDCISAADRTRPQAEQSAALFECRKAAARALADSACDRLQRVPQEQQFTRARLPVADLAAGFAGAAVADGQAGTPAGSAPPLPAGIGVAAEAGDAKQLEAASAAGAQQLQTVLTALQRATAAAGPLPPVLVDVGAGSGMHAFVAAALGYPVIAFEADPRRVDAIYQTLCWNPELRDRVTLFPHAAIGAGRTCHAMAAELGGTGSRIVCSDDPAPGAAAVRSLRLGDYLEGVQADVLKIDAEGYEPRVLSGAGVVLDAVQYVIARVDPVKLPQAAGRPLENVAGEFMGGWQARGFELRLCDSGPGCLDSSAVSAAAILSAARSTATVDVLMRPRARAAGTVS